MHSGHFLEQTWFKHILFDQSLLQRYNIIEVGSDSKPLLWSFPVSKLDKLYLSFFLKKKQPYVRFCFHLSEFCDF